MKVLKFIFILLAISLGGASLLVAQFAKHNEGLYLNTPSENTPSGDETANETGILVLATSTDLVTVHLRGAGQVQELVLRNYGSVELMLKPGVYEIVVNQENYAYYTAEVRVEEGGSHSWFIQLTEDADYVPLQQRESRRWMYIAGASVVTTAAILLLTQVGGESQPGIPGPPERP